MTWSLLDLAFTSNPSSFSIAWLPPWKRHNLHVSWQPIQISAFLQIEAARPIYDYMQSPDFTPATSSPPWHFITLPARLLAIAEMKATSKLRPPHPSAERPLQGVRGSFLSVNCRHADTTSSNVPYFSRFTLF